MSNHFQEPAPATAGLVPHMRAPARLRPPPGRVPVSARSPAATGRTSGPPNRDGGPASDLLAMLALPIADALALVTVGVSTPVGPLAGLYGLAVLAALWAGGLHRLRICLRVSDQAGRILAAVALPALILFPFVAAGAAVRLAVISAGLVLVFRLLASAGLRLARRRGLLTEPALVVGSGTFGGHLAQQLGSHPELGLAVRGFLDDGSPRRDLPQPVLGGLADLPQVVARLGIRRVIICFGDWSDEDLVTILRACRQPRADVCVVPRLHDVGLAIPRGCLDEVWGIPLIPLRRLAGASAAGLGGSPGLGIKRLFDLSVAAVLLVAAMPLLLVLAAAIRLRTGQSPLFSQRRVTGDGRQATVLKLRTITDSGDSQTCWTVEPQRSGALGRWLRTTHLDELPQLINVLRGEMSLVGPRPERQFFADRFGREIPRYGDRDRVRAGLTGWAQVHGLHGDTSIAERSRFDNQYIEYWSPWLDVVILLRTVGSALAGLGARR
jgi:exopolysaccharide biosynthesis polyprenyl glycosylphosphotransferase